MANILEGNFSPPVGRFAILAARFNGTIVEDLVAGCVDGLRRHGVPDNAMDVIRVPGSFEIPLVARKAALSQKYVAVICLGCVVRGETSHYDHVAGEAASGVARAGLDAGIPVVFGILTTENMEQALNRSGGKSGNKGFDAALTAIEMVNLLAKM